MINVQVVAPTKNDYSLRTRPTNQAGVVQITLAEVKEAIHCAQREFPMDYDASIGDCQYLRISVESAQQMRARIERLRVYYPERASELEALLTTARNDLIASRQVTVPVAHSIKITVRTRRKSFRN
jgi:hypothetical protein